MSRKTTLMLMTLVVSAGAPLLAAVPSGEAERPNFVLVLLDDLGFDDLGRHGNELVETPHIDAFAEQSVRFGNFYVNPVCAPTRASLLTGRHHLRTGVSHVGGGRDFLALGERTLAEALREGGYATGMWGKWHLGKTDGYHPWQRGFDEAYEARLYEHHDGGGSLNGEPKQHEGWTAGVLTDYALDFMERHREGPFFAYLPYLTCHSPLAAPERHVARYRALGLKGDLGVLYGMVEHLDHHFGRLLEGIDRLGLRESTVVLFLSDNGPWVGTNTLTEEEHETRYVSRMRGHKGDIWENGVRSPLFVRWPGHFQPADVERLASVIDLHPTLLELARLAPEISPPLDGRSIGPYLRGDTQRLPARRVFSYAHLGWMSSDRPWTPEGIAGEYQPVTDKVQLRFVDQALAVRGEREKLLLNPHVVDHEDEVAVEDLFLYDIASDRVESRDLAELQPETTRSLRQQLLQWWNGIIAEEHSFVPPTFLVGRDGAIRSEVTASAPSRVRGQVVNTLSYIGGWRLAGDQAVYRLDVHTPGRYQVSVDYAWAEGSRNAMFRVAAGRSTGKLRLLRGKRQFPAHLELPEGEVELKLTLYRNEAGDRELGLTLTRILLERPERPDP